MSMSSPLASTATGLLGSGGVAPSRTHPQAALAFRPDLEGLRGVAVLSVLAVHAFPDLLRGGFIGVDIFFVLSGYLISTILFRSIDAGRFSILDFYAARIRRLYPALCLVLIACLVFSVWFTFPSVSRQVGHHVAAGALFMSNIALWNEAGYFDAASETKPLLHLWSLGIEEQFYIVWPVAVLAMSRYRRWALLLIVTALVLSFVWNIAWVVDKPKATFFLPPTRFWELLVGALLAYLTVYRMAPVDWISERLPSSWKPQQRAGDLLSWAGMVMLAIALWLIDKTDHFPGWWALLPTLGTFALIAAGHTSTVNRHLLAQPVLRFCGAISYPLYLWHWPLLSFPVALGIAMSTELRIGILVTSVLLAVLTVQNFEKPVRSAPAGRTAPMGLFVLLIAIGASGWLVQRSDGWLNRYPVEIRAIASAEFASEYPAWRVDECFLRLGASPEQFSPACSDSQMGEGPSVFLWGDSHAAALYPGLSKLLAEQSTKPRLAQFTAALCPPLLVTPAQSSASCEAMTAFIVRKLVETAPDTVVLGGHWLRYSTSQSQQNITMAQLRTTVLWLKQIGVRHVVVFGQAPTWTIAQPRVVMAAWNRTHGVIERAFDHLDPASAALDEAVSLAVAGTGAQFVSPMSKLCNESGCLVAVHRRDGMHAVAYDNSHLGDEGSIELLSRSAAMLRQMLPLGKV